MSLVVLVDARDGSRDPGSSVGASRIFGARVGFMALVVSIACVHLDGPRVYLGCACGVLVATCSRPRGVVCESASFPFVSLRFPSFHFVSPRFCIVSLIVSLIVSPRFTNVSASFDLVSLRFTSFHFD